MSLLLAAILTFENTESCKNILKLLLTTGAANPNLGIATERLYPVIVASMISEISVPVLEFLIELESN